MAGAKRKAVAKATAPRDWWRGFDEHCRVSARADAAGGDDRQPIPDDGSGAANQATGPGQQGRSGEPARLCRDLGR